MPMSPFPVSDLIPLSEAARWLRQMRRPRGIQTLRDRIRRGTLRGIRKGRYWYVYPQDLARLASQPYHAQGGRPPSTTASSASYTRGQLTVDVDQVLHQGELSRETRLSAMLASQALWFGIKRAQLEKREPKLSPQARVLKMFQEIGDGERFPGTDVLRTGSPHPR